MRIPNPFKRKKVLHKRNPAKKLIAGFLFVPICFVLSIIIAFFWLHFLHSCLNSFQSRSYLVSTLPYPNTLS